MRKPRRQERKKGSEKDGKPAPATQEQVWFLLPKTVLERQMFFLCSGAGGKRNIEYTFVHKDNHKINLLAEH